MKLRPLESSGTGVDRVREGERGREREGKRERRRRKREREKEREVRKRAWLKVEENSLMFNSSWNEKL